MSDKNTKTETKITLPLTAVLLLSLLSLAGLFVALYLTWLHHQVFTNPSFHSFCAMSDEFNCETVAESPYSVFLGMPVASWGVVGYLFMFALTTIGLARYKLRAAVLALLATSSFSVLTSIALAIVSYCIICSFCVMCTVTYAINAAIFLIMIWCSVRSRLPIRNSLGEIIGLTAKHQSSLFVLSVAIVLSASFYPKYWRGITNSNEDSPKGITENGHYWLGASSPSMTIVEFSDYLCPHCRRAHQFVRHLVNANPDKLRIIHRQFPLDDACNPLIETPFHPGACLLARAALCAGEQQKFWEMNDLLYEWRSLKGEDWKAKVDDAARRIGINVKSFRECNASEEAVAKLRTDIDEGIALNLQGTPSFVVDGKVYIGAIEPNVLQEHGITQLPK